jgi:hypothetical protein
MFYFLILWYLPSFKKENFISKGGRQVKQRGRLAAVLLAKQKDTEGADFTSKGGVVA